MFKGWGKKKEELIPVEVELPHREKPVQGLVGRWFKEDVVEAPVARDDVVSDLQSVDVEVVSERSSESKSDDVVPSTIDVPNIFAGLEGGSGTADAVRALARKDGKDSLYMISNLKQPSNITKLRLHAEYADSVGFKKKARFLRFLAEVHCEDVVSKEGDNNRARMVKEGLNVEVNKEFEIEKRSKMGALQ